MAKKKKKLGKVICIRITAATLEKLESLIETKFDDRTISWMAREALIRGIAKLESEKVSSNDN